MQGLRFDFIAKFYSFYFSWGFYYSAGLKFCIKKYEFLPLMGYKYLSI